MNQRVTAEQYMSTALVTTAEAEESYRYRNERVAAQFVRIDPDSRPDSTLG